MSINNIEKNYENNSNVFVGGSKNFDERTGTYKGGDSSTSHFEDSTKQAEQLFREKLSTLVPSKADYALREEYYVPLNHLKQEVEQSIFVYNQIIDNIDSIMNQINVDYLKDANLEESHKMLWREVVKNSGITTEYLIATDKDDRVYVGGSKFFDEKTGKYKDANTLYPDHISFEEYLYAQRSMSVTARRLVKEYERLTSHSVFSYLLNLRQLILFILNELYEIREILTDLFGEDYEDDSQKQIGVQLDSWTKMSLHYAQRIADTITATPQGIPVAEVDKISEKQAVEFQAFFAIRLDAVNDEVDSILQSIKRDLVDSSEIFYKRYLNQAIRFKNKIVNSMEIDYHTTSFSSAAPFLTEELLVATNVMNANFGMILTDMIERYMSINSKMDEILNLISDKRKYSNYIFQLAVKGRPKKKIVKQIEYDQYIPIFKSAVNNITVESDLVSNHASLDNLEDDHHPQYLKKDGGSITGDIFVENSAKIDGVHLSTHAHSGADGSERIRSVDIDYQSAQLQAEAFVIRPISLAINSLITDIIDGGVPVVDMVLDINVDDEFIYDLEYEVIVAEVD